MLDSCITEDPKVYRIKPKQSTTDVEACCYYSTTRSGHSSETESRLLMIDCTLT